MKAKIFTRAELLDPKMPADLSKALAATPRAKATWDDITPIARRDWIHRKTNRNPQAPHRESPQHALPRKAKGVLLWRGKLDIEDAG
jgi:hypothetical protein